MADPKVRFVPHIPDLMDWDDYDVAHEKKVVKFQLRMTEDGIEIVGDSPYPELLEAWLAKLDPQVVESMLCG